MKHLLHFLTFMLISFFSFAKSPNIILITADDLGHDDLSVHGNPISKTPFLDELAHKSVQFKDFYVTPVCAPTRASLLTGRHFYKGGVSGVHGGRDYLSRSETLISDVLQSNDYRTGTWGKWHLGKSEGYFPWDRGFDESYYAELYVHKNSFGFFNGEAVEHNEWVSKVVTDYAIDFMSKESDKPFFAYLSYLAPHEPWLAPEEFVKPYIESGEREAIANLYGMIEEMDFHVGRVFKFLEESKLSDNTIVIFMSDNGPWWDSSNLGAMTQAEWETRNPSQMNGNKGQTWQNGHRSPLFIYWPNKWEQKQIERYVEVKDIFPTLMDYLNIEIDNVDGQSFLSYLEGDVSGKNTRMTYLGSHDVISNKPLFNQWTPIDQFARDEMRLEDQLIGIRGERFKLLLNPAMDREGYPQPVDNYLLFDLQNDPLERKNVINDFPKIALQMKEELNTRFLALRDSKTSFATPIYTVGNHTVSVINGFGPAKTSGNVKSKAHTLTQFKQAGDYAVYDIDVVKAQEYDVYLKMRNTDSAGIQISFANENQKIVRELSEDKIQKIGSVNLTQGATRFTLKMLANNSYKPWAEISGLRRIFFIPKGEKVDLHNFKYPN